MQKVRPQAGEGNAEDLIGNRNAEIRPISEIVMLNGSHRQHGHRPNHLIYIQMIFATYTFIGIIKYQLVFFAFRILIPHLSFMLELVRMKSFFDFINFYTDLSMQKIYF
jgi:hypothetical protein